MKYRVRVKVLGTYDREIEADSIEEAEDEAYTEAEDIVIDELSEYNVYIINSTPLTEEEG